MGKYSFEDVKSFIENNSDCVLLDKEYKDNKTKMRLKCKCGVGFEANFAKFKYRNKRQCNKCSRANIPQHQPLSYDDVKNFIEVESESECKLLSENYINAHQKLKMLCKCGNVFETKFNHFKSTNQRQCGKCGRDLQAEQRRLKYEYVKHFIEVESKSGCKLLSEKFKNTNTRIRLQCKCGNQFTTLFPVFRDYDRRCCDMCSQTNNLTSKGELKIERWLVENSVIYDKEVRFNDCRNKRPLPFDFVVYKDPERKHIKMIIEYDGKQHFGLGCFSNNVEDMKRTFEQTKENDETKNDYCFKNSYPLLRIPYSKLTKIEKILSSSLLN